MTQEITVKTVSKKLQAKLVAKEDRSFSIKAEAKTDLRYKKVQGNKAITVSSKGKVTVRQGLPAGTYTITVRVTAKEDDRYEKAQKKVKIKIKVK